MARRFLLLWLLVFLGYRACGEEPEIHIKQVVSGYILKSTDGDLLALYGIECPSPDDPIGIRSKELTETIVRNPETKVIVKSTQYGVTNVDIVTGDNVSLSELLLREGLARWVKALALDDKNLKEAEESAQKRGVGLWQHTKNQNKAVEKRAEPHSGPSLVLKAKGDPVRAQTSKQAWDQILEQRALQAAEEEQIRMKEFRKTHRPCPVCGAPVDLLTFSGRCSNCGAALEKKTIYF